MEQSLVLLYRNRNNDWAIRILQQHTIGRELTEHKVVNTFRNLTSMTEGRLAYDEIVVLVGTEEIPKTFSKFTIQQLMSPNLPTVSHTWRLVKSLQDDPRTILSFYENMLEKIKFLTKAAQIVRAGDRYLLIYLNDANAICFRILSKLEMSVESTRFSVLNTNTPELTKADQLAVIRIGPKGQTPEEEALAFASGKVHLTSLDTTKAKTNLMWQMLDEMEKSTDLDNWLYDYLEMTIPRD